MSQLLLITDFDLPPDQVQSFLSTTFYFSFLVVFFALFCFLFLCLLLLVAVNVAFHGEQELRRLSLVSISLYLSYLSCLSYEKNS